MTLIRKLLRTAPDIEITETDLVITPNEPDERTTLEKSMDGTTRLLEKMNARKDDLEATIKRLSEELRQVNVVIEGASAMAGVLQGGRA